MTINVKTSITFWHTSSNRWRSEVWVDMNVFTLWWPWQKQNINDTFFELKHINKVSTMKRLHCSALDGSHLEVDWYWHFGRFLFFSVSIHSL